MVLKDSNPYQIGPTFINHLKKTYFHSSQHYFSIANINAVAQVNHMAISTSINISININIIKLSFTCISPCISSWHGCLHRFYQASCPVITRVGPI